MYLWLSFWKCLLKNKGDNNNVAQLDAYTVDKKFVGVNVSSDKIIQDFSNIKLSPNDNIWLIYKLQLFLLTNLIKLLKIFCMGYLFSFLVLTYESISHQQTEECVSELSFIFYMICWNTIKSAPQNVKQFNGKMFLSEKILPDKSFVSFKISSLFTDELFTDNSSNRGAGGEFAP